MNGIEKGPNMDNVISDEGDNSQLEIEQSYKKAEYFDSEKDLRTHFKQMESRIEKMKAVAKKEAEGCGFEGEKWDELSDVLRYKIQGGKSIVEINEYLKDKYNESDLSFINNLYCTLLLEYRHKEHEEGVYCVKGDN